MTTAEWISLAALIISAAGGYYAYQAPIRAAKTAESLRQASLQRERELNIFSLLMSERGRWGSATMLTALNAVKIIFRDNQEILTSGLSATRGLGQPADTKTYISIS